MPTAMIRLNKLMIAAFTFVLLVQGVGAAALLFSARVAQFALYQAEPKSGGIFDAARIQHWQEQDEFLRSQSDDLQLKLARALAEPRQPAPTGSERSAAVDDLKLQIQEIEAARAVMRKSLGLGEQPERVVAELKALMRSSVFGVSAVLAGMHPEFLNLMLLAVMGSLGSLVMVLRNLKNQFPTLVGLLATILSGQIMAFALYAIARSAVGTFFMSARVDGGVLNFDTFTVAAIGMIAGLLGDDLVDGIRARANSMLRPGEGSQSGPRSPQPDQGVVA